ncbi:MAG: hypothetical protein OHK0029_27830 [Armatimonadaceae bacterium]
MLHSNRVAGLLAIPVVSLGLAPDGYLYVISNQLHRQPQYNNGTDLREKPYLLWRLKTDAKPVRRTGE